MALTTIVMTPIGPVASRILSAHPIDMDRNCFVASSPNSVTSGPTAVPMVLMKSDQSSVLRFAAGEEVGMLVDVGDAIFSQAKNE